MSDATPRKKSVTLSLVSDLFCTNIRISRLQYVSRIGLIILISFTLYLIALGLILLPNNVGVFIAYPLNFFVTFASYFTSICIATQRMNHIFDITSLKSADKIFYVVFAWTAFSEVLRAMCDINLLNCLNALVLLLLIFIPGKGTAMTIRKEEDLQRLPPVQCF